MNKIIIYSFSFVVGGLFVYINDHIYIKKITDKNKQLTIMNEKLSYELNKFKNKEKEKENIEIPDKDNELCPMNDCDSISSYSSTNSLNNNLIMID